MDKWLAGVTQNPAVPDGSNPRDVNRPVARKVNGRFMNIESELEAERRKTKC